MNESPICERCSRARTTILIAAVSRKEAEAKAALNEGEVVHTEHYNLVRIIVIRKDTPRNYRRMNGSK